MITIRKALNDFEEGTNVSISQLHSWLSSPTHVRSDYGRWNPPPAGVIKINTDASFNYETCEAGYGFVGRNSEGRLLDGCAAKFSCLSPEAAKGIAVRAALLFAISRGFPFCPIHIDSNQIVQLILTTLAPIPWDLAAIIHEIKDLMQLHPRIQVFFSPRSANKCANWVAVKARNGYTVSGWSSNPHINLFLFYGRTVCNFSH
ncbi:uncharacterized protein LOC131174064 [Hevea brasiliensis]|uniref:uncharacterized protein LOC131174064 n=1 Tax=Hevea brasiliensis TaxID=3981 RepID=UPI0025DB2CCD|nr:uncharacterized protein LOC131174064 [Hevea brasiliensis]